MATEYRTFNLTRKQISALITAAEVNRDDKGAWRATMGSKDKEEAAESALAQLHKALNSFHTERRN